jgi:HlyD family secretion protein/epimerase transport system membrane fusion protein
MTPQGILPSIKIDPTGDSTRLIRTGLVAIAIFFGGLGGWAATAPISGAIVAEGTIKIDTQRKTIQHFDGGIVKEISVKEGSLVKAGQPLIVLEDTTTRSNMNILDDQYVSLRARETRALAEKGLSDKLAFPPELANFNDLKAPALLAAEQARFQMRRKALNDQLSLFKAELAKARESIPHLNQEIQAIRDGIEFGNRQIEASEKLLSKHFIQESEIWRLQNEDAARKERLSQRQAALSGAHEHIAALELQMTLAKNQYIAEADMELQQVKKELLQVEEQRNPAKAALSRQVITAPLNGQILDLKVTTIGGVIRAGDPLMDIVPTAKDMLMEVKIKNSDVDDLHLGQEAHIQLSAFNTRTTPLVKGHVVYVAGDSLKDPVTNEPYYPAHIKVTEEERKPIADLPLSPGMPVTAFVNTGSRTFVDYLLAPVVERARKAIREQ